MKETGEKTKGSSWLSWPKLIIGAVAAGVLTAVFAIVPALRNTSFHAITVTFEVWILCGILIIMNSKSNLDAALKCFVFFLISQPLVYLIQVPFSWQGWGLFGYYRYWFIWTLFCLPMGFVGYFMKKGKWWGYLILLPMILLTGYSYLLYFSYFLFYMPGYILVTVFCAAVMILYPVAIFKDKKIRIAGALAGGVLVAVLTALALLNPPVYSAGLLCNGETYTFDDSYTVTLDPEYGEVEIRFMDDLGDYMVCADFRRAGDAILTLTAPDGSKKEFDVHIERSTYEVTERK